jgi:hypothetical protein
MREHWTHLTIITLSTKIIFIMMDGPKLDFYNHKTIKNIACYITILYLLVELHTAHHVCQHMAQCKINIS